MIIGISSEAFASDGVEHRAAEKAKADDYEQNVEHETASRFPTHMGSDPI